MSRLTCVSLAAGWAVLLVAGSTSAQTTPAPYLYDRPNYGVGFRPQLSPFLDLANRGDPAINYFLGTLPELDRRYTQRVYGAAIGNLAERALAPTMPVSPQDVDLFTPLPSTGHPVAFGNTGGYFPGGQTTRPASSGYTPAAPRR